jgi:hypothetical protein
MQDIIKRLHAERQIEARINEYEQELPLTLTGVSVMPNQSRS